MANQEKKNKIPIHFFLTEKECKELFHFILPTKAIGIISNGTKKLLSKLEENLPKDYVEQATSEMEDVFSKDLVDNIFREINGDES